MDNFVDYPAIYFVFYFVFLLATLAAGIISLVIHKHGRLFSILTILLVPVLFFSASTMHSCDRTAQQKLSSLLSVCQGVMYLRSS